MSVWIAFTVGVIIAIGIAFLAYDLGHARGYSDGWLDHSDDRVG